MNVEVWNFPDGADDTISLVLATLSLVTGKNGRVVRVTVVRKRVEVVTSDVVCQPDDGTCGSDEANERDGVGVFWENGDVNPEEVREIPGM